MSHVWPAVRVVSEASGGFFGVEVELESREGRLERLAMNDPDEDQHS